MENSRVPDAAFWTFVALGVFLFSATSRTSAMDAVPPASADQNNGDVSDIAVEDLTWIDTTRGREVPVRIYAPNPKQSDGPFPIVVFSHGGGESREAFTYLGTHWAKNGYVAVFLTHLGNDLAVVEAEGMRAMGGGGAKNFHLRPEDVRFVLDKLLSEDPGSELVAGRIARDQVAAAGQCAGGTTALAMVGLRANLPENQNASFIDPRFKCAVALSPQPGGRSGGALHTQSWARIETPTLMVTGTRDFNWFPAAKNDPSLPRMPFNGLPPGDKYLVDIKDAEHNAFTDSVPYYPARERDPRHHRWIQQATTAFLDAYLKGDAQARAWLQDEALEKETKGECAQEQKLPAERADDEPTGRTAMLIRRSDRDGDGALSQGESPDRLKAAFDRIDANRDGKVTREELAPLLERVQRRGGAETRPADRESPGSEAGGIPEWRRRRGGDADVAGVDGPHSVAVIEELVLHDGKRDKDLTLRITYPQADGKFPLILFSHCARGKRDDFRPLVAQWASHGYVVVQMDHAGMGNAADNWQNCVTDSKLVLDSLAEIGRQAPSLASRMDASHVGAAGHLIGAYASCALVGMKGERFGPGTQGADFSDPRINAALLLSPQGRGQGLTDTSWEEIHAPMLVAAGSGAPSLRTSNPPEWRTEPYYFAKAGDKYLLWIEGMDNSYAGLWRGGVDPRPAAFIREVTTAFWDAYLKSDGQARQRLRAWPIPAADKEQFRLENKTAGSLVPTVPPVKVDGGGKQTAGVSRSGAGRYDFGPLDRFLKEALPRLNGGCSFILIQGDRVIHRKAHGTFTPETVVPIASASKWISGGVIMALVDEGKIGLDDKASKYLPKFKSEKADITIRQMFSHTHGFAGTPYLHRDTRLTLEEAVDKIADVPLTYEPGTHLYYSGLGMQVAGRIAEIATGKPWVEIFREQIGGPLGMDKTTYYAFGKTENPNVAGSVETCIDDYGAFVTMVLNHGMYRGQRVLSEKAVETMLSIQSGNVPILHHPYVGYTDFDPSMAKMPYGIGCWLEQVDAATGLAWRASSGGAFGCQPFVDSKRNVAGVFLPRAHNEKRSSKGIPYNDASVVYLQLRDILNTILDGGQQPSPDGKPEPPSARTQGPVPSPTAATVWPAPDADSPSETATGSSVKMHGELAADYSAENGGRAVLVMVAGKVVFERYDSGCRPNTATHLHSATKGFWGPVIAAMIEDGLITSYDELASKTLPEWKEHPRKSRITLRHLLTLSAGLVQDVENLQGDDRPTLAPDLYKHAIGVQALREPGATFQYGPSCYYVLGEIMKRKLAARKQTPLDYLKRRILHPIGVEVDDWVHDASGNPHIPNGAYLTARNWAKYGQWLLQGGEWSGKQIVKKNTLEELVKPSKANSGHGLALWLNQPGGQGAVGVASQRSDPSDKAGWIYRGGHSDLFAALGAGKCRMYVIPSLEMVVVRQGDSQSDRFDDNTFLTLLLKGQSPDSIPRRRGGSDQSVEWILRQMDRNSDGKIAPNEAGPQLRRWFDRLDQDGDGTLDATELRPILEQRRGSQ